MSSLYYVLLLERARVETSLNQELEFGPKLDLGEGMRYRVAGSLPFNYFNEDYLYFYWW